MNGKVRLLWGEIALIALYGFGWCIEIATVAITPTGLRPPFIVLLLAGLALLVLLALFFSQFVRVLPFDFSWLATLLAFVPTLASGIVRTAFADRNADTFSYHLYNQITSFQFDDYFPTGPITSFLWPTGDIVFGLFRRMLGYRLGTLLNLAVAFVLLTQIIALLRVVFPDRRSSRKIAIMAALCLSLEYVSLTFGTYLIDLLPLPLFLIATRLVLTPPSTSAAFAVLALFGLSIAIKLTSVPYFTAFLFSWAALLIAQRPEVSLRQRLFGALANARRERWMFWLGAVAAIAAPSLPLVIYNGLCTGNPFFPFFNRIFASPFFRIGNFRDGRWGPRNFGEWLDFPILSFVKPERFSEMHISGGRLALGFFVLPLVAAWRLQRQKREGRDPRGLSLLLLGAFAALTVLLWVSTTGYVRYIIGGEILVGIFIAVGAIALLDAKGWPRLLGLVVTLGFLAQATYSQVLIWQGWNWSWQHIPNDLFKETPHLFDNAQSSLAPFFASREDFITGDSYVRLASAHVPFINLTPALHDSKQEKATIYSRHRRVSTTCAIGLMLAPAIAGKRLDDFVVRRPPLKLLNAYRLMLVDDGNNGIEFQPLGAPCSTLARGTAGPRLTLSSPREGWLYSEKTHTFRLWQNEAWVDVVTGPVGKVRVRASLPPGLHDITRPTGEGTFVLRINGDEKARTIFLRGNAILEASAPPRSRVRVDVATPNLPNERREEGVIVESVEAE